MKIFYILPHCSSGGMPQYVLKQSELFSKGNKITVFEVNNVSDDFVVQRNQFKNLVQLNGDQALLLEHIKNEKPDILHFQEIPETFLSSSVIHKIYNNRRKYNIIVTTHSCEHGRNNFTWVPDKIIAVSNWQQRKLQSEFPDIEVDIWEYPIENLKPTKEEKDTAKTKLYNGMFGIRGVTSKKPKHILNVGLFTPGKNQGELFEIARKDSDNYYHFVGNQAGNFAEYWKPLMVNKPNNCIIWGERSDVDFFYKACDEMYFTSTWELYPVVIREALSYGLPIKMHKLDTYGSDYDNNPLITFV
jgi:glycosyltransferase involved in cell wall biosynthesis